MKVGLLSNEGIVNSKEGHSYNISYDVPTCNDLVPITHENSLNVFEPIPGTDSYSVNATERRTVVGNAGLTCFIAVAASTVSAQNLSDFINDPDANDFA